MTKSLRLSSLLVIITSTVLFSCRQEEAQPLTTAKFNYQAEDGSEVGISQANMRVSNVPIPSKCNNPALIPYLITLESTTDNGNGTYTWIWSIKNQNPGNGNGGTYQDLSHWNIDLNNCCPTCSNSSPAQLSDVVSAATSTNGTTWQSFTPTLQRDPSLRTCANNFDAPKDLLKFDVGTSGSAKTYYRLVLSRNFQVFENAISVYKSGKRTACGQICYPGIGCAESPTSGGGTGGTGN